MTSSGITSTYKTGDIIFREGMATPGIFYIQSGIVKIHKRLQSEREQILFICATSDLLGHHALLSGERYSYSATALSAAEVTLIEKEPFLSVLQKSPALANMFLKTLGHEFLFFMNKMADMTTKSVDERLASALIFLDAKFETYNGTGEIKLSRGDLANFIGTAKETLVRSLHKFQLNGLIEKDDRIIRLVNRERLINYKNN